MEDELADERKGETMEDERTDGEQKEADRSTESIVKKMNQVDLHPEDGKQLEDGEKNSDEVRPVLGDSLKTRPG